MTGKRIFTAAIAVLILVMDAAEDHRFPETGRRAVVYTCKNGRNAGSIRKYVLLHHFGVRCQKCTVLGHVRLADRIAILV